MIAAGLTIGMLVELRRFDPALARARQAVIEQDRLGAIKWATSSLERRPSGPEAVRIAAHQLSELLFPDEAEAYYQRLHTLNRFEKQDAHVRALGLTRANQREKAVAAYEEILAGDPTDALALQRLAALQWLRGRSDDALAVAERLAKTSEGAVAGHTILAEVSHEVGRRRDAIVHFRRVLEIDPELRSLTQPQVIFYAQFGGDLLTEGLASEARTVLRKAVETNREPGLFDLMGRACLDDGDPVEAAEWWRRSTEIDPERVAPWLHLGKLALKGGNPAEAAELLNRALSLAPAQYEILTNLATAYRLLGQPDEARDLQARAAAARQALPPTSGGMGGDAKPVPRVRTPSNREPDDGR